MASTREEPRTVHGNDGLAGTGGSGHLGRTVELLFDQLTLRRMEKRDPAFEWSIEGCCEATGILTGNNQGVSRARIRLPVMTVDAPPGEYSGAALQLSSDPHHPGPESVPRPFP